MYFLPVNSLPPPSPLFNVAALLELAAGKLKLAGIAEARIEAGLLLQDVSGMSRSQLFLHGDSVLPEEKVKVFMQMLDRRCRREPLQYITGIREFWSREFLVSSAVLVPRPETEFLLEHVLFTLRENDVQCGRIIDMCTGSGVIGIVLAHELGAQVLAVDLSKEALQVAGKNIKKHHLEENVSLLCSDLFSGLAGEQFFDLIVSNPPYIADHAVKQLDPEVRDWEPRLALSGGRDGLVAIRRIVHDAANYLRSGGWLFVEIGADQKEGIL
ncbi:MAG: peptide chain release factor N(5)-glutamine methyltransferase, partial [Desulfobulbaceae bacterium]|nr:peptide chain release factor N(5)-glutamine methyltransferase [Desulfobulbaceae bacterium]